MSAKQCLNCLMELWIKIQFIVSTSFGELKLIAGLISNATSSPFDVTAVCGFAYVIFLFPS